MGITIKSRRVITVVYATSALIVGDPLLLYAVPAVGHYYWIICVNAGLEISLMCKDSRSAQ